MRIDVSRSALLIIDVQNDFCPGGALAVAEGDLVVPPANAAAAAVARGGGRVVATQDWHPRGHVSFASAHPGAAVYDVRTVPVPRRPGSDGPGTLGQALWPDHCVQGTSGADFHPGLDLDPVHLILRKGTGVGLDSYSAFYENDRTTTTGLDAWLRGLGVETVVVCGLATDYCVFYTAQDARRAGFTVVLLEDACRGVGAPAGSIENALAGLRGAGVGFARSGDLK